MASRPPHRMARARCRLGETRLRAGRRSGSAVSRRSRSPRVFQPFAVAVPSGILEAIGDLVFELPVFVEDQRAAAEDADPAVMSGISSGGVISSSRLELTAPQASGSGRIRRPFRAARSRRGRCGCRAAPTAPRYSLCRRSSSARAVLPDEAEHLLRVAQHRIEVGRGCRSGPRRSAATCRRRRLAAGSMPKSSKFFSSAPR